MTLDELDKNSKYGYRRKSWRKDQYESYIAFSGTQWIFVSEKGQAETLDSTNAKACDWYLSDIPNKFYKRVAVITKSMGEGYWPVGTRIIKTDRWSEPISNAWILADYSNRSEEYHTLGASCEWEDEMTSIFPCFRKWRTSTLVVEFTAPKTGTVVVTDKHWQVVGYVKDSWRPFDDSEWEPCEDPNKRKFKVGDTIQRKDWEHHEWPIVSIGTDRYIHDDVVYTLFSSEHKYELVTTTSCSLEPITPTQQKENTMDLRLLLAMMAAMSNEETPKDATNSKHVVIVTKNDEYEGYFYADDLKDVEAIIAEPKNELKKFHIFDYQTTLAQKPRKVVEVKRS